MNGDNCGYEDFLAAFGDMESAVADFDNRYADYDFSSFTFDQLWKLENSIYRYPAYKVREAVFKARAAAAERENEELKRRDDRIRARYGYYCEEDVTQGLWLVEIKAYERAIIRTLFETMAGVSDREIRKAIKACIPPITDEEIDAYRKSGKEK